MNEYWVDIFKTGTYTSGNGYTKDWTAADLDRIVYVYNNQPEDSRHDAPAVKGHPTTDGPAQGWFTALKREGNLLKGLLRDPDPSFREEVKAGRYRKVSPKIDSNFLLKHVGWLGATPPAVKGLPEFSFSAESAGGEVWECEFNEDTPADPPITQEDQMDPKKKEGEGVTTPAPTPPANVVSTQEFEEFKAAQEAERTRIANELAAERRKTRDLEFNEFLNSEAMKGRVTPAMRDGAKRLMHALADSATTFEFSEDDGNGGKTTVKRTALDDFKALLGNMPVAVEFGEFALDGNGRGGQEFAEAQDKALDDIVNSVI